jgi:hypothetical protein
MKNWKGIVGRCFTPEEFKAYIANVRWDDWQPEFIVLHNTEIPSLAQRPNGLTMDHILGLEKYYRDEAPRKGGTGWSAGPHLFIDDTHGIWVFTPLTTSGRHSPSWNEVALGVEMLGDYDKEEFDSGRGAKVRDHAVAAVGILSAALRLDPATMRLHREDPETDHHCPGDNVDKDTFIEAVKSYIAQKGL